MITARLGSYVRMAMICSLSACSATPGSTTPPTGTVDMAGVNTTGLCTAGETRSCGCLGSSTVGTKTCGTTGAFGACTGCPAQTGDGGTTTSNPCTGCQGCCQNGTTCLPLASETDTSCGAVGKACAGCTSPATCNTANGKCATSMGGGGGTCSGCVDSSGNCYDSSDVDGFDCGANGGPCTTCQTDGALCQAGNCTDSIDPNQTYEVSIRVIDATTASGYSTDCSGEENPDPFVCLTGVDDSGNTVTGCSGRCSSVKVCNLSESDGVVRSGQNGGLADSSLAAIDIAGSALKNGSVQITVWDDDEFSNDQLASGTLPPITQLKGSMQIMGGPYTSAQYCARAQIPIEFEVQYEF